MAYEIDTSEIEARAATLAMVESNLGAELDACDAILADISYIAERTMGGILCGVSAAQLVGLSSGDDLTGEIIATRGSSFVGGYVETKSVITPDIAYAEVADVSAEGSPVPSLIFRPVELDELTEFVRSYFPGHTVQYHAVGVPLVGNIISVRRLQPNIMVPEW